eukprot:Em0002g229a
MTTRSGKPYKKPTMEEMQGMLKLLAEDRRRREDEIATEKARREDEFAKERARLEEERQIRERENRKQMETMQTHMAALMKLVEDSQKAKVVSPKRELSVKLVPLSDKDDIEAYLITFERVMTAQKVEESCWSQYLAPQLTGKAQLAFAALPGEDSGNYEAIKTAILQRYDITEEAYRRRFRGITRGSGETNRELSVKLMDLLRKWMKSCTSMEEIQELIGMEQFLNTLPANKRLWVMERKPKTCIQAGELVDEYEHARREESQRYPENVKGTRSEQKCSFCGKAGHSEDVCYKKTTKEETSRRKTIVCYNCGKPGHPARKCPNNEVLFGRESKYKVKDGMYYIKLVVEGIPVTVEAAVADSLPVEVILGTDASRMTELLGRRAGSVFFAQEHVMVVTTRAKRRQEIQEEVLRKEKEVMSGVVPNPLGVSEEEPKLKTMSQEQRRQMRRELGSQGDCLSHINITAEKLKDMQEQDETLRAVRELAALTGGSKGEFFKRDELLYRRWTPRGRGEEMEIEQLDIKAEIGPGNDYCAEPFSRIAMDIVGPLPRSRAGNKYILVICDYATRYPEAVPLKSIDAESVAEELIKVFARMGVPREILTDQGANFTSQLLAELYRLLQVHPIRTSPYHPQTDGLVERFNQTLKSMLRKTGTDGGKEWDKKIPYLLFAYREVPQASTGFSPFELLYGRDVRGPLDILKEVWETTSRTTDENVISYVLSTRERLREMSELVQENLSSSQRRQKSWFDKGARLREFKTGDSVLVLLPTSSNRLLAQWQGPYQVVQRMGKVNYLIDMQDRRKRKRVFHVNMLKDFHVRENQGCFVEEIQEEADIPSWRSGEAGRVVDMGEGLDSGQKKELKELLGRFAKVFSNKPGKTTLYEHRIHTNSSKPVRLPPYRVPHAYRNSIKRELQEMERSGIIEPTCSEWASPIVVVPKRNGELRLCVDYRRLNSVSQVDSYLMPRIDELIDRVGKANFITTLDLTTGYWQIPMADKDKCKTAFVTPFGSFQFTVMPFGLSGAPASFQRLMDRLLQGCEDYAVAYIDDFAIFSSDWQDHLKQLQEVLMRIEKAGLTVKLSKSKFAKRSCEYLGYIVGGGVVKPILSKVEAISSFPKPDTKTAVRAFLGLAGYYRRFIPDFASVAAPLTDLTKKSVPNSGVWNEGCQRAFETLKKALISEPVLSSPDVSKTFIVQTDASDRGVGAVLSQVQEDGQEHPVGYYSRKLLAREQRYSTIEKECLAIKLALDAFKVYLLGRKFVVQTDHRALEWLEKLKENNARLCRWSLALQPYSFGVEHRPGTMNLNADALSRNPATALLQEKGKEV